MLSISFITLYTGTNHTNFQPPIQDSIAMLSAAQELPPEVLYQIFKYLNHWCLKKTRLICKSWSDAVDGNSKLMNLFTVKITDIELFLQSHLATNVRSVRFTMPLAGTGRILHQNWING